MTLLRWHANDLHGLLLGSIPRDRDYLSAVDYFARVLNRKPSTFTVEAHHVG